MSVVCSRAENSAIQKRWTTATASSRTNTFRQQKAHRQMSYRRAARKSVKMTVTNTHWILTSCQPHRLTTELSEYVISKCTVQNSSHYVNSLLSQIHKLYPYTNIKQSIHTQASTTHFRRVIPCNISLVKKKKKKKKKKERKKKERKKERKNRE